MRWKKCTCKKYFSEIGISVYNKRIFLGICRRLKGLLSVYRDLNIGRVGEQHNLLKIVSLGGTSFKIQGTICLYRRIVIRKL